MTEIKTAGLLPLIRRAGELLASSQEGIGHLNCSEIQGAVDLLIAAGLDDVATDVVYSHGASGDDDASDLHHNIYLAAEGDTNDDPEELARDWVASVKRGDPLYKFRGTLSDGTDREFSTAEDRDHQCLNWYVIDRNLTVVTESWTAESGWSLDAVMSPAV